jgi:putative membrane protein
MRLKSISLALSLAAGLALTACGHKLSDAEKVHVLSTANNGEKAIAQLALERSTNPAVQEFARKMIDEHDALDAQTKDLASRENLTPTPNPVSEKLQLDVNSKLSKLSEKSGAEFDKAFVDANIDAHKKVISEVENELIPNAQNGALKGMLKDAQPKLKSHLDHAEALRKTL